MATVQRKTPAKSYQLHKAACRHSLPARREPYWGAPVGKGKHVGIRKIDSERMSWIARYRPEGGQQVYKSFGPATDHFGYEEATAKALDWFKQKETGITGEVVTVADACRRYVEERTTSKSAACGHDAKRRFERTVYDTPFGNRSLEKLRAAHMKQWRDGLGLEKATSNRTLISLKAALNLAVRERNVIASQAQEWRDVKPLPGAKNRRDLFLDLTQRRALLTACEGSIRDLIESVMVTGARAGELTNATRRQFDQRTGSITLDGKTGPRTIPLSPAAVALFTRLAKSKLPAARLLIRDDGEPWAHSDWDQLVRAAAIKAELPKGVCLYTLRHSFITTALTSSMSTLDVARLVGTSLEMIDQHYGHLVSSAARERLALVAFT